MGKEPSSLTPSPKSLLSASQTLSFIHTSTQEKSYATPFLPTLNKSLGSLNDISETLIEKDKPATKNMSLPPRKPSKHYAIGKLFDFLIDPKDSDQGLLYKTYSNKSPQDVSKKLKSTMRRGLKPVKSEHINERRLELSLTKVDLISRQIKHPKFKKKPRGPKIYISQEVDTGDPDFYRASPMLFCNEDEQPKPGELSRILGITFEESQIQLKHFKLKDSVAQSVEHMVREQAHRRGVCRHRREKSISKLPSLKRIPRKTTAGSDIKLWERKHVKLPIDMMTIGGSMG